MLHFYKFELHQMPDEPSLSSIQLLIYCIRPFLFSHSSVLYFLHGQPTRELFFELTFVQQIICPLIFKFIFVTSFLGLASLAILEFFVFIPRSFLSNDRASIYFFLDMICMYRDFQCKNHD